MKESLNRLGLSFGLLVLTSCSATIEELDSCGDLAHAVCERMSRCDDEARGFRCERLLGEHCVKADKLELDDADQCAAELEDSCGPALPASCGELGMNLGCYACTTSSPSADLVQACCSVDPFSAVCGGCL